MRLQTSNEHLGKAYEILSSYVNRKCSESEINTYIETFENGILQFFQGPRDFEKYCAFVIDLFSLSSLDTSKLPREEKPLELSIEILQKPPQLSVNDIFGLLLRLHQFLGEKTHQIPSSDKKITVKFFAPISPKFLLAAARENLDQT